MATELDRFTELFHKPSVEAIYDKLTPTAFEHFIAYVLRRAGYDARVVGPHFLRGVDVEMRLPGKPGIVGGVECKHFLPERLVVARTVRGVKGAAAVDRRGAKPYVVTTSGFNDAAYQMADEGRRKAHLLNGGQLIRYINYVRESRYDEDAGIPPISPEYFAGR